MYSLILPAAFLLFAAVVTLLSYRLGKTRTDSPSKAALIGFFLSFLPPLALIYLVILLLKEDTATV